MSPADRPALRPYLQATPENASETHYILHDMLRLSGAQLRFNPVQLEVIQLFNGKRSLHEVQSEVIQRMGGQQVPLELFSELARQLDEALFLDTPRYREKATAPVRPPSCLGAYHPDPQKLRQQLSGLFNHPEGSGPPDRAAREDSLRAVLVPHIDYARGGLTYTFGFKELFEKSTASLFVIIGTSHYSRARFTLTRKHFQTPLGTLPTDQKYIDRIVAHYGDGLFEDELMAHLPEHSIELEVVFLQYLYESGRDIRIVPLLVGSFHDCIAQGEQPGSRREITRMVAALQAAEREAGEKVCYIISGDLAHIGPKFDDPKPLDGKQLARSRQLDQQILGWTEKSDPAGLFESIAEERDARRICGLPPTWLTLAATQPSQGRVLGYGQYAHPRGYESVSFASVGFDR